MGDTTETAPAKEQLDAAKEFVKMMIFAVESRPKGFDYRGILLLVSAFISIAIHLRGENEPRTFAPKWLRKTDLRPVPGGKKRSDHLVDTLRRFNHFLAPEPGNVKGMYELYFEIRTQMFELVDAFRRGLESQGNSDAQKLNQELSLVTERVIKTPGRVR